MGRSLQCYILTGCTLYRGVIRRERPACRPAPPLTNRARSRTLKSLPPKLLQNFPHEHPHKPKRTKFSPRMGGCSWGKFGEDEGGLEGEGTPSERGSLLPPRSFFFPPQKFSAAPMTVPNWEFSGIRKRTPNPPDAVIDSKTRRIGAIVVRLPVRTMSRRL